MKSGFRFSSIVFMIAVFFAAGCGGADAQNSGNRLKPGQMFNLKNLGGVSVGLEAELKKNKAVLINFWATWCPPCREEIPDLIELQKEYEGKNFTVLGIDIGESHKKVSSFVKKMGINYPVLLDSDEQAAAAYGIVGIPTSILVRSDGTIVDQYHSVTKKMKSDVKEAVSLSPVDE